MSSKPTSDELQSIPTVDEKQAILASLSPKQQGTLRLVCKALGNPIREQLRHASTSAGLSRTLAQLLGDRFPALTGLVLFNPITTFHLHTLRHLTRVDLVSTLASTGARAPLNADLAPLECLPSLRTLHLEGLTIQRLQRSFPQCGLAALTQLQTLRLASCLARSAEDPVSYTGPGLGNDLSALPGVTMLQTVAQLPRGLLELQGFTNMHKVQVWELQTLSCSDFNGVLAQAMPSCTALHTLVACGLSHMVVQHLHQLPCLEALALNYCHTPSLAGLLKLNHLRYLDISNSAFGSGAEKGLQDVLQMPSLQLCILKVPSLKAASALLKGSSKLSVALMRSIATRDSAKLIQAGAWTRGGERDMAREVWLCDQPTEDTLRSHKLLSGEAWDQLRQAEPCPSDCRLIAFLKLVATGFGYRNVSLRLNTTNVFPAPYLECPFELPGQQLSCALDSSIHQLVETESDEDVDGEWNAEDEAAQWEEMMEDLDPGGYYGMGYNSDDDGDLNPLDFG